MIPRAIHAALLAVLVLVAAATPTGSVMAQGTNKIGTAAAPFLRIPVGARSIGMGNAFVSMTDDPSALYWNAAVLTSVKSGTVLADHSPWLPGITFDFFGLVLPFEDMGTLGISATILQTNEMDVTTPAQPMGTGETFRASSIALGVSYGRSLTDRFAIGGTFRYIREVIYNSTASGIAFDIGTIFETPLEGIRLGASIANFGTQMRMEGEDLNVRVDVAPGQEGNNQSVVGRITTDEFDLPLIMRLGISGEVLDSRDVRVTLAADGVNPNDNAVSVNVGSEVGLLNELIRVRAGYRDLFLANSEFGFTAGIGIHDVRIVDDLAVTIEYAYQDYVHLGQTNRFTVSFRW